MKSFSTGKGSVFDEIKSTEEEQRCSVVLHVASSDRSNICFKAPYGPRQFQIRQSPSLKYLP